MALETIEISDVTSGTSARVLVGRGFNCYRFQAHLADRPIDVLWSHPELETGRPSPSGSGIPILFPFPGRLTGRSLEWQGRSYLQDTDDGQGNAIHGFVHRRSWRVIEQSNHRVVGQFQASLDDRKILEMWPADFRITVTYEVGPQRLTSLIVVENPGEVPLPFGLGTHPYFRVPIAGGSRDDCFVRVPVSESWQLEGMLPTGQRTGLGAAAALPGGMPLKAMQLDDVYTGISFANGSAVARILDASTGLCVSMSFDRGFRECVIYNPSHQEAVCVEPYTCVPDAVRLAAQGVDSGLQILEPGQSCQRHIEIRIEE